MAETIWAPVSWSQGGGEDSRLGVVGTQHGYVGGQLGLVHVLGPAEEDSGGVLHLVVEELSKVLHIDLALHRVHHGDKAVQFQGAPPSRTRSTAAMTSDSLPTPEGSMMMRSGA